MENAEAVYAEKTSTQDVINQAWSDLLDVLHLLEFKPGDTSSLESLVEQLKGIGSDPYTEDSYQALQDALAEAEAVLADENAMDDSIKEAYDALLEAAENLQFVADLSQLEMLMAKADEIFENAAFYTDDGWDALEEAYEAALAVTEDSEQSAVDEAAQGLVKAIAAMRLKADKSQLQAEVDRANQIDLSLYTKASVRALEKALDEAYAILENEDLSEDDQAVVDAGTKAVVAAIGGLVEIDKDNDDHDSSNSSSSNKGSTSANVGNAYGAAGVVAAGQNVSASAYVVSDTTVNFNLKRGSAYCFKMTVVNGNAMTPSFTVGNGNVLKTQFVAKVGNDYYYRVYATGTPGQSTGVYTTLPGNAPVKHCAVTIG